MKNPENYLPKTLMKFAFQPVQNSELKVIGVGGGGCNAVDFMFNQGISDVLFINCNTDNQALEKSPVPLKVQLGASLTGGRGAGANPETGRAAAIESLPEIVSLVKEGTDMVFITAGMGGGTGTGAAPVIAGAIRNLGILTVAIVTVPFTSEKSDRIKHAKEGIQKLQDQVDALIVIENDKINENYGELKVLDAFRKANEILAIAAQGIIEIIKIHGHWNVDFNDVKTVMTRSNVALMGTGIGTGSDRAMDAVQMALSSPLLNMNNIRGAKGILLNIMSGHDEITMHEHQQICTYVQEVSGHASDQFIIGVAKDDALENQVKVTIIATGFPRIGEIEAFKEDTESPKQPQQQALFADEETMPVEAPKEEEGDKATGPHKEGEDEAVKKKPKRKSGLEKLQRLIEFLDDDVK